MADKDYYGNQGQVNVTPGITVKAIATCKKHTFLTSYPQDELKTKGSHRVGMWKIVTRLSYRKKHSRWYSKSSKTDSRYEAQAKQDAESFQGNTRSVE